MPKDTDIVAMYPPTEYFSELRAVIKIGLKEAKISREARKALTGWWDAESTFIQEALDKEDEITKS